MAIVKKRKSVIGRSKQTRPARAAAMKKNDTAASYNKFKFKGGKFLEENLKP